MENLPDIGDVLDDTYELVSVMGTGGFGAVYRARQLNMNRDVALKMLVASGPKFEEMAKRFRREVMAIRNLTHPNTVRVFDFHDDPDGLLYYTMEALDGKTLSEELEERGPMAPRRVKRVVRQVLKSLSEAHSFNIVHRDLKPGNVMLVDMHGETDFVKVLDFGIAKMLDDRNEEGERLEQLTSAGILVGTLRYMAPEQIAGESLGAHTDLYALGLISVEMLTGESVFAGTGRWDLLQQQISDDPVDIPAQVLNSGLGPVVTRCLQKDRDKRFRSTEAVLEMLDAIDDASVSDEPLYMPDGDGGWKPRESEAYSIPSSELSEVDDELDELKTEVMDAPLSTAEPDESSPNAGASAGADLDDDRTEVSESPFADELKPTKDWEAVSVDDSEEEPAVDERPQPRESRVDDTDATGEVPDEVAAQEPMVPANEFSVPSEITSKQDGSNRTLIAGVVGLVVVVLGAGIWMLAGEPEADETGQEAGDEALAERAEDEESDEDRAREAGTTDREAADDSDDEESEVDAHAVKLRLEDDVVADVFVDDEKQGTTPHLVEFDEESVVVRFEADGYESLEARLHRETPEEVEVAMQPDEEDDDEAEEVIADRGEEPSGSAGASGSGGGDRGTSSGDAASEPVAGAPDETDESDETEEPSDDDGGWVDTGGGAEETEPEVEADDEEEVADDEDDGWVDIGSSDEADEEEAAEEAAEEDDDVPLF